MHKENLFKLISKEDAVLWAGAGLSMYAGLPSGTDVARALIEGLSSEERRIVNKNLLLPDLAEEIFRIKGSNRNYIIQKLREIILLKKFKSIETHNLISKVPHLRNIITTNYDTLFEAAFKSNVEVIYDDKQIPFINDKKVNLFKIHGDLSLPDSIIITKSDYENFFGNNRSEEVIWTLVKEKIATKSILFVGYNLEDPNVSVIFDKITNKLGSNRKECFLVSPNLPAHKVLHLSGKGIHYINSTGEEIILELIQYLKDNVKKDFENKNTSPETYSQFIRNFNLKSDLEIKEETNIIKNLSGIEGEVNSEINFTIRKDHPDAVKFLQMTDGNFFDTIEIGCSAFTEWDHRMEGIKITSIDELKNVTVMPVASFHKKVAVVFENGYEINDVEIFIYRGNSKVKFLAKYEGNEFELIFHFKENGPLDIKMNYRNAEIISNVSKQLPFYQAMDYLIDGEDITVYSEGKIVFTTKEGFDRKIIDGLKNMNDFNFFFFEYFKKLKEVEKLLHIKFSNIKTEDCTDKNDSYLSQILAKHKKEDYVLPFNGVSFTAPLTENNLKIFSDTKNFPVPFMIGGITDKILIHDQEFQLGNYQLNIVDSIIPNLEKFIEGKEEKLRIESKSNSAILRFVD